MCEEESFGSMDDVVVPKDPRPQKSAHSVSRFVVGDGGDVHLGHINGLCWWLEIRRSRKTD